MAARAAQTRQTRSWPAKAIGQIQMPRGPATLSRNPKLTNSAMVIEMNENATPKDSKGFSVRWNRWR